VGDLPSDLKEIFKLLDFRNAKIAQKALEP
jgi:hypothetical protein